MTGYVAEELEEAARRYANEAIRFDSQGARGTAIQFYQKAISTLIKLANLYPDYDLNKLYMERARAYQERVKALQGLGYESSTETMGDSESVEQAKPPGGGPAMVQSLKASYDDLILKEKPSVKWDDVIGLEETKKAVKEAVIFPSQRPDLFPLGIPKGILMFGPPGCGKTLLAAAAASEIEASFITVDAASIMSKWLGDAEKNVARLFNTARKTLQKDGYSAIIFIDELDSLLGARSHEVGAEVRVRNQFLGEMDGLAQKGKDLRLYVMGSTNKPWQLDWGFLRRFQKRLYVPLPDFEARSHMFSLYTAPLKLSSGVRIEELGKLTEGYSGSDVLDICQGVQLRVVSELFESGNALDPSSQPRRIEMGDFKEVLRDRRPSVSPEMVRAYEGWSSNFRAL